MFNSTLTPLYSPLYSYWYDGSSFYDRSSVYDDMVSVKANGSSTGYAHMSKDDELYFNYNHLVDTSSLTGNVVDFMGWGDSSRNDGFVITEIADPVPEPATMLLFGTGLVGLVGSRIRKKKKQQ